MCCVRVCVVVWKRIDAPLMGGVRVSLRAALEVYWSSFIRPYVTCACPLVYILTNKAVHVGGVTYFFVSRLGDMEQVLP